MSNEAVAWAMAQDVLTVTKPRKGREADPTPRPDPLGKWVLTIIANEVSTVGWSALLPMEYIASRAMCTDKAAREIVERVEAAGFLRRHRTQVEGRHNAPSVFRFYLLAPASPVVQGRVEIDWDTPEVISREELEQVRDSLRALVGDERKPWADRNRGFRPRRRSDDGANDSAEHPTNPEGNLVPHWRDLGREPG
ncbi:hypothetical protein, partial [Longimycelium tulufanense]|uniref:hypothetical protein n=1 Tax=Longimycelium tulufanense TaxID=907463 RepID=UPI00166BA1F7